MEGRLQRRVQRYGWDLAAAAYEPLWRHQLTPAQEKLIECAALRPGERVLDVACGTGLAAFGAAAAIGLGGRVVGIDLSGGMIDVARAKAHQRNAPNTTFLRMDAESLDLPDGSFDVALCAFGLMYMPEPERALQEMRRVLCPGGRMALAVWGERAHCGWSGLLQIVDAEVRSDVCPLFFRLGQHDTLARACVESGLEDVELHRIESTLSYLDADEACRAAFIAGPVALAWSRFDDDARARVRQRYVESLEPWRREGGYEVPAEFVVAVGNMPS